MRIALLSALLVLLVCAPSFAAEQAQGAVRKRGLENVAAASHVFFNSVDENGFPQSRIMSNLHKDNSVAAETNGKIVLYFVTHAGTRKVSQLRANAKVSAFYLNPKNLTSSLFTGTIDEVSDATLKKALWADWMKSYSGSPEDPNFVLLRLTPVLIKVDARGKSEVGAL